VSKLIIRKRVELDFLGDEYKEAYLVFRSIPVSNYDKILGEIKGAVTTTKRPMRSCLKILKEYYIEGKFPDEKGVPRKIWTALTSWTASTKTACLSASARSPAKTSKAQCRESGRRSWSSTQNPIRRPSVARQRRTSPSRSPKVQIQANVRPLGRRVGKNLSISSLQISLLTVKLKRENDDNKNRNK
jgi:hypothetical protein